MEVWDGDNVPGAASQRKRLESVQAVGDVGDDHSAISYGSGWVGSYLARVHGNALPRRWLASDLPRRQTVAMRFKRFVPAARTVQRSELFVCTGGSEVLDIEAVGPLERPTSPDVRDVVIVVKYFEVIEEDRPDPADPSVPSNQSLTTSITTTGVTFPRSPRPKLGRSRRATLSTRGGLRRVEFFNNRGSSVAPFNTSLVGHPTALLLSSAWCLTAEARCS